jgi:hypothetical protein
MIDADFEARFRTAHEMGELKPDADPGALAILATATLHTIAIRARAGARRDELREITRKAVSVRCAVFVQRRKFRKPLCLSLASQEGLTAILSEGRLRHEQLVYHL